MKGRRTRGTGSIAIVVAAACSAIIAVGVQPVRAGEPGDGIGDGIVEPQLQARADAAGTRVNGGRSALLAVELLTEATSGVAAAVRALGGIVTGAIPGEVVQATLAPSRIADLAAIPEVREARSPRRVNQRPQPNFGPTTGQEVGVTNAAAWHTAGIQGALVRVGIIDYFDMSWWNPAEHGPVPTLANGHAFCADTTGLVPSLCTLAGEIDSSQGLDHGVAVAEIVKDMAPQAEIFIATVGSVSDLMAAVNWFAVSGVSIITRSLGSAWDGPGDGSGPLDAVVDAAAAYNMVWFNSAGNEAVDHYLKRSVPTNLGANQYVDFDDGPGVDTWLRIDRGSPQSSCFCVWFDGIRWSTDWYVTDKTDYAIEFWQPTTLSAPGLTNPHANPGAFDVTPIPVNPFGAAIHVVDSAQVFGADPIEASDLSFFPSQPFVYLRMKRNGFTSVGAMPDVVEIALAGGAIEQGYASAAGSASGPVVDSRNPSLLAVGAVDIATSPAIAYYSSQGPTPDGRIKPDIAAPACFYSTIFGSCFQGTSASSPAAAGMAALLLGHGLAVRGDPLAALVRHLTIDRGPPGPDNAFGVGEIQLPAPPSIPVSTSASKYVPLAAPTRILDTRPTDHVGPATLLGPYPNFAVVDLRVAGVAGVPGNATAVAVNITSTDSNRLHYVQALPTLGGAIGATSTLNISTVTAPSPNFAIVSLGDGGRISLFIPPGGNVIVDLLGWFEPTGGAAASAGRFVAIDPERWLDSRSTAPAETPAGVGWPRRVTSGETAVVVRPPSSAVPATGVAALVLNVTSTDSTQPGFLRAQPAGATGLLYSTVNYLPGSSTANTVIVPVGANGAVSVFALQPTHIVVDVAGYFTSSESVPSTSGLFMPVAPSRVYDSRITGGAFGSGELRATSFVTPSTAVPSTAVGVSANLTVTQPGAPGFLRVFPTSVPATSNVNYSIGQTVANGALFKLSPDGAATAQMSAPGHVIIDINGYFTGPS